MTATYTFDVLSTLDGYGSFGPGSDWGGYWKDIPRWSPRSSNLRHPYAAK